jgi:hypothetical protein
MSEEKNLEGGSNEPRATSDKPGEIPDGKNPDLKNGDSSQPQPVPIAVGTQPVIMEVQKHPHHVTHKKKWSEYLLEFLMIFLAVFLGFVAENKREQLVEKKKALEYMSSFYDDLRIDDRQLQVLIPMFEKKNLRLDTMLTLLKGVSKTTGANGLYKYYYEPANYPDFIYTDRTIQQLKNSGGLRLITKKEVSDSIIAYDASVKQIAIAISEAISEQIHLIRQMNNRLFDLSCCPEIGQYNPYNDIRFPEPGTLLTYDEKVLAEYYNSVLFVKRIFSVQRVRFGQLRDQNNRLQQFLKKEYHLE